MRSLAAAPTSEAHGEIQMKPWLLHFLVITTALHLASCKTTVRINPSDMTAPIVKMDLYGVKEPGQNFIGFADCCNLRRTVGISDVLTLVASAEDRESGISSLEIVAVVISECRVIQSFRGSHGVPDGPPVG